jgi:hypothetical protein
MIGFYSMHSNNAVGTVRKLHSSQVTVEKRGSKEAVAWSRQDMMTA